MRKRNQFTAVLASLLLIVVVSSCVSCATSGVPLTPLQKTELAYTDFADGYTLAMQTAVKLDANGQLSATQVVILDAVQKQVRAQQPIVLRLLNQWAATQIKPSTLDAQMSALTSNLATVKGVTNTAGGH